MIVFLSFLCIASSAAVIVLGIKLYLVRKSMEEIRGELERYLGADTNVLLTVSTRDKKVRALAAELNRQLRALREQRWKYQSGDRELKEAVTNISHDLRTPLTAVCGYLHLLAQEECTAGAARYLALIENRLRAMTGLTEELFRYSVILSGETQLSFALLNVGNVLEESLSAFYAAFTGRGIVPEITMPKEPVIRKLDRMALSRVFENLLNNALKYSDGDLNVVLRENGEVCFSNAAAELDEVLVGRIFDRFFTVSAASKGGGLGLSIAKTFARRMGGQIWAEYRDGRLLVTVKFERED